MSTNRYSQASRTRRREAGDKLLSGSFCTGGACHYRAEQVGLDSYAVRLAADARTLVRRETPLQVRFRRILRVLLIVTGVLGGVLLVSAIVEDTDLGDAITATTATITTVVPEGLLLAMTVAFAVGAVGVSRAGALVQDINAVEGAQLRGRGRARQDRHHHREQPHPFGYRVG